MAQKNNQLALRRRLDIAEKVILDSPMTLARHGVDPKMFAAVVQEAVLNNPDILKASESSLAKAFRKCARDGYIPDGDSGAIVVFGEEAQAMPMVTGIKRLAYEKLGAEIRSGVVHEGDVIEIVDGVGVEPKVIIRSEGIEIFKSRKADNVVGAWCWLKLPHEDLPRIVLYSYDEIMRAKKASRAQNGPWKTWPDRMAEKACVKSAIWRLRYMSGLNSKAAEMFQTLAEDNEAEYGTITLSESDYIDDAGTAKVENKAAEETKDKVTPKTTGAKATGKKADPKKDLPKETETKPEPEPTEKVDPNDKQPGEAEPDMFQLDPGAGKTDEGQTIEGEAVDEGSTFLPDPGEGEGEQKDPTAL